MARDPRKRQKALARRAAKRKAKKKTTQSRRAAWQRPGEWPLLECLIATDWRNTRQISHIVVARKAPTGDVAVGCFLVDLACLGIKNVLTKKFPSEDTYQQEFRTSLIDAQPMENCDLNLAAKVIDEAIQYARSLGFAPHRDASRAFEVLGKAKPQDCAETVPLGGENGKPLYVGGPYDDERRILQILERNVGEGNFDYVVSADGLFPDDF